MKKLLGIIMVVLLTIGGIGCSKEAINQKTEEELRAEIKAELEDEAKESKLSTKDIIDIKDKEVLKSFIIDNYKEAENADFENMVIKYHDFTKDGIEDVVCYFDNDSYFLDKPIFISVKDNMLYEVPNDMSFHYTQEVDFDNDFIFYTTTGGGTGISDKYKYFYVYNGIEIKYTEASILIEGHSSGPGFDVERYGEVVFDKENNYKNFTYKEVQTGSETYEKEFRYVYDAKQQKFDIEEIASSNNKGQNVPAKESTLSGFEPEMLYSNDEELYIDYSRYFLVVVPMQKTKNANKLSTRFIEVTNTDKEFPLKFSVFGELESFEIEYYENSFDEPKIINIDGPIKDEVVTINAYLPTDSSYVKVKGLYVYQSGKYEVSFTLDDMRDATSYTIYALDEYSSH